ncbi:hypothetical protein [Allomuricauda sp. d1]|uniref:hypothetical protein n=1 Tax=Allomuricauda sp. d1 TaxID=3136725 RepID=UPI0031DC8CEA
MGLDKGIVNSFKRGFENKCLRLITDSYSTALEDNAIKRNWDENDITAQLHQHIKDNPLRLEWNIYSNVEEPLPKKGMKKEKGFAAKLSRIDLKFSVITSNLEYVYHMEAKNLKENDSALKRRYINTGINNFLSGKYQEGCLLGYVLEGAIDKSINGINKLLKKDKRTSEFLSKEENSVHGDCYRSNHPNDFSIQHFMFDFTSLKSA